MVYGGGQEVIFVSGRMSKLGMEWWRMADRGCQEVVSLFNQIFPSETRQHAVVQTVTVLLPAMLVATGMFHAQHEDVLSDSRCSSQVEDGHSVREDCD